MSGIEVRKYGGSSLECREKIFSIVKDVFEAIKKDNKKRIIVVSAMGDTTDRLESLYQDYSDQKDFIEKALLLSTGELQSSALVSIAFKNVGLHSEVLLPFNIPIETQGNFLDANIKNVNFSKINKVLERNDVVIIPGFQGIDPNGNITLLGRGGSDTTAISLSAALGLESCVIFSDVKGVYNSDPGIIENAKLFSEIDYDYMRIMSENGASVMHYKAVDIAEKKHIKIKCRHSFEKVEGTDIISCNMNIDTLSLVHDNKVVRIVISDKNSINILEKIFDKKKNGCDIYKISENKKGFVFSERLFLDILNKIKTEHSDEIYKNLSYDLDIVKISLIGKDINIEKIKKRVKSVLKSENIGYDHIFQGKQRYSILVRSEDYKLAMKKIYDLMI